MELGSSKHPGLDIRDGPQRRKPARADAALPRCGVAARAGSLSERGRLLWLDLASASRSLPRRLCAPVDAARAVGRAAEPRRQLGLSHHLAFIRSHLAPAVRRGARPFSLT